jgi:predicted lysophospholipase L1 biosynthesis ABC-type transport system permease subunit
VRGLGWPRTTRDLPEHGPRARRQGRRLALVASRRSARYPLRGTLRIDAGRARPRRTAGARARHGLGRPALLDALQLKVGDTLLLG